MAGFGFLGIAGFVCGAVAASGAVVVAKKTKSLETRLFSAALFDVVAALVSVAISLAR